MRIEQYLTHTDHALWEVIINGDSPVPKPPAVGTVVSQKTEAQKLARKNKLKAKSTLLLAIPDEHLLKFHSIKDAKSILEAIKIRFRGNKESKKMHKTILKQKYENFVASRSEGLDKTYDRFQKLISQLELNGEVISQEDANMKLLRSLPLAWNNITIIMRNKPDIETLSMDDLYNNLKVYEAEIKGQSSPSSNSHNVAFVSSENTSSINETVTAAHDIPAAGSKEQPFASSYANDVMFLSLQVNQTLHNWITRIKSRLTLMIWKKWISNGSVSEIDEDNNQAKYRYIVEIGYHAVPPPYIGNYMPPRADLSFSGLDDSVFKFKISETRTSVNENESIASNSSKEIKEEPKTVRSSAPIIEDWESDSEDECEDKTLTEQEISSTGQREVRPVWNNARRMNHQNFSKMTHPHPKRNFVPTTVATKSGQVLVNAAKQNSAASTSTARPKVNTAADRTNGKNVTIAGPKAVVNAAEGKKENAVKSSECWIWRTKGKLIDHTSKDSRSYTLKRFNYGDLQYTLQDQGIFDSGCSKHITGNNSFLTDYQEIDGGVVAFGGSPKGGKITGKGKIRSGKLDFEDVYFVKELKFNLFFVSQMSDKKNSVLFIETECLVLSPDFKLLDESQVLLKVPRQNNMYSFDLKNVVPSGHLTCLFAKATIDESNLWHRRLGHINFKTLNKLVRGNLVRVKMIFRYLKGQPKLGLWYPKDPPFELEAYTDSDYAGSSLDRKSTTGGCQFLVCRLISWQCKKQTVVVNSITKAEYVAASSCCGQKKQNPKRKQRKEAEVSNDEPEDENHVPTPSSDPLPSGEDSFILNELMVFCTSLQEQVLDLHEAKAAQAKENAALKKIVSKLNKWKKSSSRGLKRLKKIGLEIALDDETQGRTNDDEMFRVDDLAGEEVFIETTTGVKDSTAPITYVTKDEVIMAQALATLKSTKPMVVVQEQKISTTIPAAPTIVTTADKGKAKMIEPEVPIKRKEHIRINEELLAEKLQAREREEFSKVQKARLEMTKVNDFIAMDSEAQQSSTKRAVEHLESNISKKQKVDENFKPVIDDSEELRKCIEIVSDDGDEDIVKDIFKKEKLVDDVDNILFRTLKTMFEHHVEDTIWKYQQGLAKLVLKSKRLKADNTERVNRSKSNMTCVILLQELGLETVDKTTLTGSIASHPIDEFIEKFDGFADGNGKRQSFPWEDVFLIIEAAKGDEGFLLILLRKGSCLCMMNVLSWDQSIMWLIVQMINFESVVRNVFFLDF
uniref:Ribonuclease H-like domain-containing protein n=1 Tax=Tanacetum cinerariifolium TaxID=118510 RepID=A0A6L2JVE4_TANCI|nr:ribonuclease H-like domain-containing protein [Tanacetum cinerariifolium]